MRVFFLLALLGTPAAAQDARRVRILYSNGLDFRVSMDLDDALEKTLREDFPEYRIEKIEHVAAYYSAGNILFEPPGGLSRDKLPPPGAVRVPAGPAGAVSSRIAVVVSSGPIPPAFMEKVLAHASDDAAGFPDAPSAVWAPAALWTIGELRGVGVGTEPAGAWTRTAAIRYQLRIGTHSAAVAAVGKPLGGLGRMVPLLRRRLEAEDTPTLLLNTGQAGIRPGLGFPPDAVLRAMAANGFSVSAFHLNDIANSWDALVAASTAPGSGLKLLCSNLTSEATGQALPFEAVHLAEVGGVRVGVISLLSNLADRLFRERGLPYRVSDPVVALKRAVRELRGRHRADLVVLVTHLSTEERGKTMIYAGGGVDIALTDEVLDPASGRKVTVELSDWSSENHELPALSARLPWLGLGEVTAELRPSARGLELSRIEENRWTAEPGGAEAPELAWLTDSMIGAFIRPQAALLPDPRALWPRAAGKTIYDPIEFWNIAAQALRRDSRAEAAVLRVRGLGSNVPGEPPESFLGEWLSGSAPVRLVRLSGRNLKALLARIPPERPPLVKGCCPDRDYENQAWLAVAGLDRENRISGVPISDEESYRVAMTEDLLHEAKLPELGGAEDQGPGRPLAEVVISGLKRTRAALPKDGFAQAVRQDAEGRTPARAAWRLNLRELSLQLADTQVRNNSGFAATRDARASAVSQLYTAGAAKLFSEFYMNDFRWDSGVSADYGRVALRPKGSPEVVNETLDMLVLDTELRHRTWSLPGNPSPMSLGPFAGLAYDTEFTKPEGRAKREFARYRAGLKLFEGHRLRELYAGASVESDYSAGGKGERYGFTAGLSLASPLPRSPAQLRLDAKYLEFAPRAADTPAELRRQLEASLRLSVPLLRELRVTPFATFFMFEGSVVRATGRNILLGVSLDCARLWKPYY